MDLSMKNGKTAGEAAARGSEAELVFFGGPILTMTEPAEVEAVAVAGGRILAAGTRASVRRFCTPATRHVDLAGRTMLPGFIDAHSHFIDTSLRTAWVDVRSAPLGPVRTMADIVDLLARRAQETKPGEWIVGWGYDDTNLAEMRHPDRRDLDRASSRHPIVLQHISGWVTASNSLALARAGIDEHVQNTETMVFQRDQKGALSGVIEASRCPVLSQVPPLSDEAVVRSMAQGSAMYLARGCTTAQEGWIADPAWITQAERALAQGLLRVRLVLYPLAQDISLEDYVKVFPAAASGTALDSEARLVLGAAKLSADGSIQAYTGYLSSPYHKCPPGKPGYRGYPSNDPRFLAARIADLHRMGLQTAVHCNGDAAIDMALDAIEAAQAACRRREARHIIIHSQMARQDQVERMARLGVIPSFFAAHIFYWGDRHYHIFMGPERARRMSPAGDALRCGIPFTLHNDTYVTPIDPLLLVWAAVNRVSSQGRDLGRAEQGIPVMEALKAVTINAAYQGFEEDRKGSIAQGKMADLVILDRDPRAVDPMQIRDIQVTATLVAGKVEYGSLE